MLVVNHGRGVADKTTRTAVTASTVGTQILPKTPTRVDVSLANVATAAKFYIGFGTTLVSTTNYTVVLNPGDMYTNNVSVDAIRVISDTTSATELLLVSEST